eukprot:GHVU01050517.1.p4 GENE.GHVU01050517.1~~GHVU01050517.1.p4  ORF type:complete len:108 (-),score=6.88 GHVU01050517.1:1271-1594(-)
MKLTMTWEAAGSESNRDSLTSKPQKDSMSRLHRASIPQIQEQLSGAISVRALCPVLPPPPHSTYVLLPLYFPPTCPPYMRATGLSTEETGARIPRDGVCVAGAGAYA